MSANGSAVPQGTNEVTGKGKGKQAEDPQQYDMMDDEESESEASGPELEEVHFYCYAWSWLFLTDFEIQAPEGMYKSNMNLDSRIRLRYCGGECSLIHTVALVSTWKWTANLLDTSAERA